MFPTKVIALRERQAKEVMALRQASFFKVIQGEVVTCFWYSANNDKIWTGNPYLIKEGKLVSNSPPSYLPFGSRKTEVEWLWLQVHMLSRKCRIELRFSAGHLKQSTVEQRSTIMLLLTSCRRGATQTTNSRWQNISFKQLPFFF